MARRQTIAGLAVTLTVLAGLAAIPAYAQDTSSDSSSADLPGTPEPVAKRNNFPTPNPYEYPDPVTLPFVPPKVDVETVSPPVATRIEPYGASQDESRDAQNKIRVYTNEVIAPVTVMDKHGELILDLEQKDFHIFDNGVEQKMVYWDLGADPLAVVLVIEMSSHLSPMAPAIRGMGSIFTATVMAMSGEAAVITYDAMVDVR